MDEDLHTYKYFMTGKFDEEARKQKIAAQHAEAMRLELERNESTGSIESDKVEKTVEPVLHSAFYNKL